MMAGYQVRWTETAVSLLEDIADRTVQAKLLNAAAELADEPQLRGRPLKGNLGGYRSLHWSRYRIIYLIDEGTKTVFVLAVGRRIEGKSRDVYQIARRLLRQGLLELPADQDEGEHP